MAIVEWLNKNQGRQFSAKEIHECIGVSQATISRKLRKLAPYVSGDGRTRGCRYHVLMPIGEQELDEIARRFGTLGARDRQIRKHFQERSLHRLALERWRIREGEGESGLGHIEEGRRG
ncbi:MAG: HTH domain-containing protein [Spirochaetia bacterium]